VACRRARPWARSRILSGGPQGDAAAHPESATALPVPAPTGIFSSAPQLVEGRGKDVLYEA